MEGRKVYIAPETGCICNADDGRLTQNCRRANGCSEGTAFKSEELATRDKERDAANVEAGARGMREACLHAVGQTHHYAAAAGAILEVDLPTSTLTDMLKAARNEALTITPADLARLFHDVYERLAPEHGYSTREETRVFDEGSKNGKLMIETAGDVIRALKGKG